MHIHLVAQLVKNLPVIQETLVRFLGQEDAGEGIGYPLQYSWASLMAPLVKKKSTCSVGYLGLIPGLGRSPGKGNGNPLQCSCLEDSMDKGAWWATVHEDLKVLDMTGRLSSSSSSIFVKRAVK